MTDSHRKGNEDDDDDDGDDLFAMFGEDDDDDDDDDDNQGNIVVPETNKTTFDRKNKVGVDVSSADEARRKMDEANRRMQEKATAAGSTAVAVSTGASSLSQPTAVGNFDGNNVLAEVLKLPELRLPWKAPSYLGPIRLVESLPFGGGRGYVAAKDLQPGTLVLIEEPIMDWPEEQIGSALSLVSVQHILNHPNAQRIIHDMEELHPTKRICSQLLKDKGGHVSTDNNEKDDVDDDNSIQVVAMMKEVQKTHKDNNRLKQMVIVAKHKSLTNLDGTDLTDLDMLRILLALRYNGIESGLYLHVAMMNHNCTPNCVKFAPNDGAVPEMRTTRHVRAGESLTISYISKIASHAYRRQHLWEQHRFDIGPKPLLETMESVHGQIPTSSTTKVSSESDDNPTVVVVDNNDNDDTDVAALPPTARTEAAVAALEDHLAEIMATVAMDKSASNQVWEEAKVVEQSALVLYDESRLQLGNENHLLLIPILRLHMDVGDLLHTGNVLVPTEKYGLSSRIVNSGMELLELQTRLYGPDHFELARTNLEIAEGIEELLRHAPKLLLALGSKTDTNPNGVKEQGNKRPQVLLLSSFEAWARQENKARKDHERIKSLYPSARSEVENL